MFIWLAALGAVLLFLAALGIFFTNQIMYIKKRTDQFIIERETAEGHYAEEAFQALPKEEITLSSPFGYEIKGYYVHPHKTKHTVIICHGVTMNLLNSVKYMNLFLELGWNAVIYDHRRHGMSGGKTTSYGYYEKEDLKTVVNWLRKRNGDLTDDDLLNGMGDDALGIITAYHYSAAHPSEANKQFVEAFKKANNGMRPNFMAIGAYDGMHVIYEAIKATDGKGDGPALLAAMKGLSYESPRGPVTIDPETRDIIQNIYLREVKRDPADGELYNIEFDVAEAVKDPYKEAKKNK